MPNEKKPKTKCVEYLRHAEYYDMQSTFDELYARSQAGEIFENLMDVILSRENILLAYRNIKSNTGSITPGTDKLKISDIGKLTADEVTARVRKIVKGAKNGYTPRSVRRKDIPKPNGNTRPLGIPCIWDRLVQQCIKQVMEPICEARFSNNSYGFRPNRSVENAIAAIYRLMQKSGLHYVVEFDIKGFFDNAPLRFQAAVHPLDVLPGDKGDLFIAQLWFDVVFDIAVIAFERTGPHRARLVLREPAVQPLAQRHAAVLGQLHITVALDVLVELVQQCLLRLGVDMTEQRLAVFPVSNDDAAFPASIVTPSHHAVTGRSSFCHVFHFLWIHFLFCNTNNYHTFAEIAIAFLNSFSVF